MKEHRVEDLRSFPSLEVFGDQLAARASRDAQRRRPPLARVAVLCCVLALAAGGTYAVPATRAAVDDVFGSFSAWISGDDGPAPGKPVAAGEDLPAWVTAEEGEKRVLAEADGEKLVAIRHGDKLTLALNSFGETGTATELAGARAGQAIFLVGPGDFVANGRHDRRPLFGLVASSVRSVRFDYLDGGGVTAPAASGAFGLSIETNRRAYSITGFDSAGTVVARLPFSPDASVVARDAVIGDFRYCPAQGCSPWQK
jgi:hypothetical protein